jgi:hypothetical protein
LIRVESEDRDPAGQCLEFVRGAVTHHPGTFGEGHADRDLDWEHPKDRAGLLGGQFDNPDRS